MPVLFMQFYNNSSPKTTVNVIKATSTPSPSKKAERFTHHIEIWNLSSACKVEARLPTSLGHKGGKVRITTAFGRD